MRSDCSIEQRFFRMLNEIVEPRVRAGWGSPRLVPGGLVVLETRGRRSGRRSRVPLAATRMGDYVVVSTFRGARSQWVKNAAADPNVRYWIRGKPKHARAVMVSRGHTARNLPELPQTLRWLAALLVPYTYAG